MRTGESQPKLRWGEWHALVVDTEEDRVEFYTKLGEAYFVAPWEIAAKFSIAQQYGFYAKEPGADKLTHDQLVQRANRIRARRGLPPVPDTLPGEPVKKEVSSGDQ